MSATKYDKKLNQWEVHLEGLRAALRRLPEDPQLQELRRIHRWYQALRREGEELDALARVETGEAVTPRLLGALHAMQSWARFRKLWDKTPSRVRSRRSRQKRYQARPEVRAHRSMMRRRQRHQEKVWAAVGRVTTGEAELPELEAACLEFLQVWHPEEATEVRARSDALELLGPAASEVAA